MFRSPAPSRSLPVIQKEADEDEEPLNETQEEEEADEDEEPLNETQEEEDTEEDEEPLNETQEEEEADEDEEQSLNQTQEDEEDVFRSPVPSRSLPVIQKEADEDDKELKSFLNYDPQLHTKRRLDPKRELVFKADSGTDSTDCESDSDDEDRRIYPDCSPRTTKTYKVKNGIPQEILDHFLYLTDENATKKRSEGKFKEEIFKGVFENCTNKKQCKAWVEQKVAELSQETPNARRPYDSLESANLLVNRHWFLEGGFGDDLPWPNIAIVSRTYGYLYCRSRAGLRTHMRGLLRDSFIAFRDNSNVVDQVYKPIKNLRLKVQLDRIVDYFMKAMESKDGCITEEMRLEFPKAAMKAMNTDLENAQPPEGLLAFPPLLKFQREARQKKLKRKQQEKRKLKQSQSGFQLLPSGGSTKSQAVAPRKRNPFSRQPLSKAQESRPTTVNNAILPPAIGKRKSPAKIGLKLSTPCGNKQQRMASAKGKGQAKSIGMKLSNPSGSLQHQTKGKKKRSRLEDMFSAIGEPSTRKSKIDPSTSKSVQPIVRKKKYHAYSFISKLRNQK